MDSGEIKRRVRHTIDRVRKDATHHREAIDEAREQWARVLDEAATLGRQFVQALRAEGLPFTLGTPAGELRLAAERSSTDVVSLSLDPQRRPVAIVGSISYARGQRVIVEERILAEGPAIGTLTEEDVLAFLLEAIVPFIER